jgi:hypothetical protein
MFTRWWITWLLLRLMHADRRVHAAAAARLIAIGPRAAPRVVNAGSQLLIMPFRKLSPFDKPNYRQVLHRVPVEHAAKALVTLVYDVAASEAKNRALAARFIGVLVALGPETWAVLYERAVQHPGGAYARFALEALPAYAPILAPEHLAAIANTAPMISLRHSALNAIRALSDPHAADALSPEAAAWLGQPPADAPRTAVETALLRLRELGEPGTAAVAVLRETADPLITAALARFDRETLPAPGTAP